MGLAGVCTGGGNNDPTVLYWHRLKTPKPVQFLVLSMGAFLNDLGDEACGASARGFADGASGAFFVDDIAGADPSFGT